MGRTRGRQSFAEWAVWGVPDILIAVVAGYAAHLLIQRAFAETARQTLGG